VNRVRVSAGRKRYWSRTKNWVTRSGACPGIEKLTGVTPPEGNQCKPSANTSMSTRPIQKVGRANVERETDTVKLSRKDPRLAEAAIPRTTPIMIAIMVDDPSRIRVF
jgi:hypothetical protein